MAQATKAEKAEKAAAVKAEKAMRAAARRTQREMCEGCGLKRPSYGLPPERRVRWCAGCAAAEGRGAVILRAKQRRTMCEGCDVKRPLYGLPAERKRRWCGGCSKAHRGAVNLNSRLCEGCGLKHRNYGLPAEGRKRWCAGCAKADGRGAVKAVDPASAASPAANTAGGVPESECWPNVGGSAGGGAQVRVERGVELQDDAFEGAAARAARAVAAEGLYAAAGEPPGKRRRVGTDDGQGLWST